MKTLILTIAAMATLGSTSFASEGEKVQKEANKKIDKIEILSPEQESLFLEGKLSETIVKPVYNGAEQFIFTEQVKEIKKKKKN